MHVKVQVMFNKRSKKLACMTKDSASLAIMTKHCKAFVLCKTESGGG